MLFNSLEFVAFLVLVYGLYQSLGHRAQNLMLLGASYLFYGWWDWRFLSLLLISTCIDFFAGPAIFTARSLRLKRLFLAISMTANLGMLFFFKYYGFFAENLQHAMALVGIEADLRFLRIVLPVGISFYTFQTMSYAIDIYRGELKPVSSFLDFALFVTFFPQLVAGPIERARTLLPQVQQPRVLTYELLRRGAWLVLLGYFKKVVVADNMAPFADEVFNNPSGAHGLAIPVAVLAFAFQIYGDFSGYSDIARGLSNLMGFELMVNFRMPYFALNPSDFWRRWHISLSTWLRDYLYIPLGGNRGSVGQTYRNLLLTMVLGGLWHGAAWHFVAWGAYHGALLCIHRLVQPVLGRCARAWGLDGRVTRIAITAIFFGFTCIGWALFRVNSLGDLWVLACQTVNPFEWNARVALLSLVCFAGPLLLLDLQQERSGDLLVVKRWPPWMRLGCYVGMVAFIVLAGVVEKRDFIYFQF